MYPLHLAILTSDDPASFTPRFRDLAAEIAPASMVTMALPLAAVVPDGWELMAGVALGWMLFVAVLLALAASGIYAIMAFAITQRTREIGIRTALAARASDIVATIGRRAAFQLLAGAVVGMPLAGTLYKLIREDGTSIIDVAARDSGTVLLASGST